MASRFLLNCVCVSICVVLLASASNATENGGDDAWRRTGNGWEHVATWTESKPRYSNNSVSSFRLDSHPAALALVELLAVVGGFAAFPWQIRQILKA
jgi:hypothetical protein